MKTLRDLPNTSFQAPLALTIGNFDGVHLGHQSIVAELQSAAREVGGESAVLSFQNHPRELLQEGHRVPRLCREAQKIRWLEELGLDHLILLPFTREFSEQDPRQFLENLRRHLPFDRLILGPDARIGKNRVGTPEHVHELAQEMMFHVRYLDFQTKNDEKISSSRIRQHVSAGELEEASALLGRPFTLMGEVRPGAGKGLALGFPTANVNVTGLCLPPLGVYAASTVIEGRVYRGVANLGHAPTVQERREVQLELHLWDFDQDLYGDNLEVRLGSFIRAEKKFATVDELREQLQQDIEAAQKLGA